MRRVMSHPVILRRPRADLGLARDRQQRGPRRMRPRSRRDAGRRPSRLGRRQGPAPLAPQDDGHGLAVASKILAVGKTKRIANAMPAPALVGLGVGPSLSPSPKARGCGAPSRRGRKKKPRQSARHAASFRFRVSRCPDPGGPIVADGVAPGSARGCSCEPHPREPHPDPTLTTPHESAPRWTGTRVT